MNTLVRTVTTIEFESNLFPASHWKRLRRFAVGEEYDPRGLFRLTDDKWDAWSYAVNGTPSQARLFRFHFGRFRTFLKLYAKWFCHQMIIGRPSDLRSNWATLPAQLMHADRYISKHGFRSVDDIASSVVFEALWNALIKEPYVNVIARPRPAVFTQVATRTFWLRMKMEFGTPFIVPPTAPYIRVRPVEFAADRSKLIPEHVMKQLANKLGLHRKNQHLLPKFDHLRLCMLMLIICLGRRIHEILLSPRGVGPDGPLYRSPSKSGSPKGSLWFHFAPNKEGPADKVFISPEWEDIVLYCVRELVKYSDEVRPLASIEERGHLILISLSNSTKGRYVTPESHVHSKRFIEQPKDSKRESNADCRAFGLKYEDFNGWLNGGYHRKGVLARWGITADGSVDGPIYRLLTSFARHSRQSALALNPQISPLTRQRDLNHRDLDMQLTYQHRLRENNDALLEKIKDGMLLGRGVEWLSELLEVDVRAPALHPSFKAGCPSSMTPRMHTLVRNSPIFFQQNRVPCGICILPQGPGGCAEFLNCTSAGEGGCQYFVVDVNNDQMLHELNNKADEERRLQQESASAGRVVQAQKRATLARRTEDLRDEAIRRASQETLVNLHKIQCEIEREGL